MSDFFFPCSIAPGAGPCCFCLEKHCGSIHALGCSALPVSLLANCGPKSTFPGNSIGQALPRWISGLISPVRKESVPYLTFSYSVGPPVPPQADPLPCSSSFPAFVWMPHGHSRRNQRVWKRLETFPCRQEVHSLVRVRFSTLVWVCTLLWHWGVNMDMASI